MHLNPFSLLCVPLLAVLATCAPVDTAGRYESEPWQLQNISIFESFANSTQPSYISFTVRSTTPGLATVVNCEGSMPRPGRPLAGFKGVCSDKNIRFRYEGESEFKIWIVRSIADPSIGPPSFGRTDSGYWYLKPWPENMNQESGLRGVLYTQNCLEVRATLTAAK
ncbi:hypothetical protein P152DRAFT_445160 [Eremomyces bilateralis CBS 781.70]|uniref:AA1-like domain-containing protein n=1 Tax=Eremomyces bilateralis CBS 781.70 TaxID=1392243 RepID=A0A6G1GFX1_9PEZI|nr:uncharacterized protein P152DRAFT_445160 [Eremomyces bilateralis CBS 781.70]KAF1817005.1 hypothetical protein P152DRAFT_445160 [Eremomyces bilateralis CBS 781.70]